MYFDNITSKENQSQFKKKYWEWNLKSGSKILHGSLRSDSGSTRSLMGSGGAHWWCTTIRLKMVRCCISVGKEWELVILVIVLKTKWWDTLVVPKMMLISGGKVAWVMSELKVDARRSDVGTRLLRRRGQQPTPIISPTDYHFPTDKDWYKTWNRELYWSMKI